MTASIKAEGRSVASTWTQTYRGRLRDGSNVAIRCHLVSALGHCFEYYLDDSTVSRVILVFEHVPNGTLRSWISGN
ncbi:hypothetical protein F511_47074 [Dorcoceras hygrometricum]|uniref:Uncharacterized protein n=1 Tax=Dorcoceras hygrometricum TaxID=472368 RepID=A0A2Z6ZT05_9LAMI|nr:hypothetical protein F511_47074 [Dorcoceras hygrometricum]